ncbi:MAG: biotin--[acetyl-CoA-carboxylase] ligase [Clostridia bacterium]|nr:biotin--[acetyl-CoA-carboxylase] ligase [Clostridia bacterium]
MILTLISAENITQKLKKALPVTALESVDSTNLLGLKAARDGAISGTTFVALRQTAGRGRLGRSFFSPQGGLYLSIVLRPQTEASAALSVTTAAATAVCRALDGFCTEKPMIKWVNDIYIADRKVCGILTEGAFVPNSTRLDYAVVGIGLNLTEPAGGYPPEIADKAGAVFGKENVPDEIKEALAAAVLNEFFALYDDAHIQNGLEEYRRRSYLDGKTVTYQKDGNTHIARVLGVDESVHLVLEENGQKIFLEAGEVSVCVNKQLKQH